MWKVKELHLKSEHSIKDNKIKKIYVKRQEMIIHFQSKHAYKRYPCKNWNFVFDTNEKFDVHLSGILHNRIEKQNDSEHDDLEIHNDDEYNDNCRQCGAVLRSYEETDDHQSNYIQCEKCNVCVQ